MAKVVTGKVRFSYANIFRPKSINGGDEKYSICLLIDKNDKTTLGNIKKAIADAIADGISSKWNGKKPANLKLPLRDGDDEKDDEAYAGMYFVNANNTRKPGIVDKDRAEILDPDEVYSGCYGRASIDFYPFNVNGNRGIACSLNHVQKLADGPRLGVARSSAEDDFNDGFEYSEDFMDMDNLEDVPF